MSVICACRAPINGSCVCVFPFFELGVLPRIQNALDGGIASKGDNLSLCRRVWWLCCLGFVFFCLGWRLQVVQGFHLAGASDICARRRRSNANLVCMVCVRRMLAKAGGHPVNDTASTMRLRGRPPSRKPGVATCAQREIKCNLSSLLAAMSSKIYDTKVIGGQQRVLA